MHLHPKAKPKTSFNSPLHTKRALDASEQTPDHNGILNYLDKGTEYLSGILVLRETDEYIFRPRVRPRLVFLPSRGRATFINIFIRHYVLSVLMILIKQHVQQASVFKAGGEQIVGILCPAFHFPLVKSPSLSPSLPLCSDILAAEGLSQLL